MAKILPCCEPVICPSLLKSLEKLCTDRVDLTLIHLSAPGNCVALPEYMTALAKAKALGLTRQIGVSNLNIALTWAASRAPVAHAAGAGTGARCAADAERPDWQLVRRTHHAALCVR